MAKYQAEIVLSAENLKLEKSESDEADNIFKLSAQKCEHKAKLCMKEFQGRELKMSIMDTIATITKIAIWI